MKKVGKFFSFVMFLLLASMVCKVVNAASHPYDKSSKSLDSFS